MTVVLNYLENHSCCFRSSNIFWYTVMDGSRHGIRTTWVQWGHVVCPSEARWLYRAASWHELRSDVTMVTGSGCERHTNTKGRQLTVHNQEPWTGESWTRPLLGRRANTTHVVKMCKAVTADISVANLGVYPQGTSGAP